MDVETELQTYKHSRQGLDEMYNEARRQLRDESQLRQVGCIKVIWTNNDNNKLTLKQAPLKSFSALLAVLYLLGACLPSLMSETSQRAPARAAQNEPVLTVTSVLAFPISPGAPKVRLRQLGQPPSPPKGVPDLSSGVSSTVPPPWWPRAPGPGAVRS